MNFGLGLVLSFTDRASSGMQNAVNTLNQLTNTAQQASSQFNDMASLTAFSAIADRVGTGMISVGSSIVSTFGQAINKINETGRTLMYAESQLDKLYEGSDKTGKQILGNIAEYAKTSIFEFEDLIPVVTMLKANGIEAFDKIASSTGNANQTLMDYAADLAAFNPAMHNAYGTGIQAAMGALNEYIAEGNARSLKSGASLDITGILGEEKGETIEERSRQVADLLEKLNMVGMTASLANSPMTKLSNMGDTLFQFLGMISDSGVYDKYNSIIDVFSGFVNSLTDERLQNIAQIIGDALTSLMSPLEKLAGLFTSAAESILQFVENNPALAKFGTIAVAISGAGLILGGVILKLASSFGYMTLMLKSLNPAFTSMGSVFKVGAKKMISSILPLAAAAGILYFSWKHDLFGIKTIVTNFITNVTNSFNRANDAISGDVDHMREVIKGLDKSNAFDNLTLGIMKLKVVMKALSEGWNGFTLNEDTFLKAKELGVLPLIEAFFDLKYRFDQFKQGFLEGWNEIKTKVVAWWNDITSALKGTFIGDALDKLTNFMQTLTNNDPEAWKNAGKSFSKIAAGLISLWGAVKLFKGISKIFKGGHSVVSTVGSILGFGGKNKGGTSSTSSSSGFLSNPKKVLKTMGSIAIILGGATLLITALGAFMSIPGFKEYASRGFDSVKQMFENLIPLGATIGGLGLLAKGFEALNISPTTAAKGIADFAILLGGMELLITAMGALNSIPGFNDFLNNGVDVINRLFGVLSTMFDVKILGTVALMGLFGFLPVSTAASGIANFAIIIGGLEALILAFGALKSIEGIEDFQNGGGELLADVFTQVGKIATLKNGIITGVIGLFGLIPTSIAASGIANVGVIAGGLEAIILAFGAISKIPGIDEFQKGGGELLKTAFEQVGTAIGGLVGGVTEGITSGLPGIGQNLGDFATNAAPFFDKVDTMVNADNLGKFAGGLASLVGTFTLEKITEFVTGSTDYGKMGTNLSSFATGAKDFFDTIGAMSPETFDNTDRMFKSLEGLGNYSFKEGGLLQFITGTTNFGSIGTQLSTFITGGKSFFDSIKDVSEESFTNTTKLFDALGGIGNYNFKEGGLLQWITGNTNFGNIGTQLGSFITNSGSFFTDVEGISEESFNNLGKLFKSLEGIGNYNFKEGGMLQWITGNTSFGGIGTQLNNFLTNSGDFFTDVKDISPESFTNLESLFSSLEGIGNYNFKEGGLLQWITGSTNFGNIGTQLKDFVTNSGNFFTKIKDVPSEAFTNTSSLFESLSGIGKYEFKEGGLAQWITGETNLGSLGTQLSEFVNNGSDFFDKAPSITGDTKTGLDNLLGVFTTLGGVVDAMMTYDTFSGSFGKIGTDLKNFLTNLNDGFTTLGTDKVALASTLAGNLASLSAGINVLHNSLKTDSNFTVKSFMEDLRDGINAFGENLNTEIDVTGVTTAISTLTSSFSTLSTDVSTYMSDIATQVSTGLTTAETSFTNSDTTISTSSTNISTSISTMVTSITTSLNALPLAINSAFNRMTTLASAGGSSFKSAISSAMSSAVSIVRNSVSAMQSAVAGMKFSVSQTHIALPHFKASGKFSANPPSVPTFSVSWYKKGGIFDNPSIIGVGEQGKEAVMPLERNTAWIGMLAQQIGSVLEESATNLRPMETNPIQSSNNNGTQLTRNVNNTTYGGSTDNSINFAEGSIQITCKNASEEEAINMAKKIMAYIKRQNQLEQMASYNM